VTQYKPVVFPGALNFGPRIGHPYCAHRFVTTFSIPASLCLAQYSALAWSGALQLAMRVQPVVAVGRAYLFTHKCAKARSKKSESAAVLTQPRRTLFYQKKPRFFFSKKKTRSFFLKKETSQEKKFNDRKKKK
jgi:hypothetical protein